MKYFKHDLEARDNRKIWKLIKSHGMTGYGIWWALLEELYKAEESGFQVTADALWLERFADALRLSDERVLIRIFDSLAELGLISAQLWHEHILYCDAVIERGDAYIKEKAAATRRKQEQRAREKEAQCHANVTRDISQNEQCHSGVATNTDPETDPETETDLESKKKNLDLCLSRDSRFADANRLASAPEEKQDSSASREMSIESVGVAIVEDKTPPTPPSSAAAKWARYQAVYNANKPALWARMDKVTVARQKALKKLESECGGFNQAIEVLINALAFVCSDSWWGAKKMDFDNLAREGRIWQFHERALARQSIPQQISDLADNPANVKFAEDRDRLLRVIQNTSA